MFFSYALAHIFDKHAHCYHGAVPSIPTGFKLASCSRREEGGQACKEDAKAHALVERVRINVKERRHKLNYAMYTFEVVPHLLHARKTAKGEKEAK
jgi:hypothetical protein